MKTRHWIMLLVAGLVLLQAVVIPRQALQPEHRPITMTPEDVGLNYEDITLTPRDQPLKIAAWWMPADPDNTIATLVFSHGGGSNRHSSLFHALEFYQSLVNRGVSVLALDLRNHGASDFDSRGLAFGLREKHDVRAAIDWARKKAPQLPVFAMGISMGGATVIQAAADGATLEGLILLDPLLDTHSAFTRAAMAKTGLPPALFLPSAWISTRFWGFPGGQEQAFEKARELRLPILLIQDPDDPVTTAYHSKKLAAANSSVRLWMAPPVRRGDPGLEKRGRWGTHVMAFVAFPEETVAQVMSFVRSWGA